MIHDNEIRDIFLAHGFTIKPGERDLKHYVYAAARALLAHAEAAARPKPREAYAGPIEPGMKFVWEPNLPHARTIVTVTQVEVDKVYATDERFCKGRSVWNDESRFREACVPA